jgi:cell filamentation protein
MRDRYEYIDPDNAYTDPKTEVLRNLADLADSDDLLFFESAVVTKRACKRFNTPAI